MYFCVKLEEGNTEYFETETGVRQGCILSPFLFLLVIEFIMRKSVYNLEQGTRWQDQNFPNTQQKRQFPCAVCNINIGRRCYSYQCNDGKQWVHSTCGGVTIKQYNRKWICLKCKQYKRQLLADLDFADNIALMANHKEGLQQLTDGLAEIARKVGLRISHERPK